MTKVTLINFGDADRIFWSAKRTRVNVPIGAAVDADLDDLTLHSIMQLQTVVAVLDGAAVHSDSPQLNVALETLRNFRSMTYDEILSNVEKVIGAGAMGVRPTREQMRGELARRTAMAAHYIQLGAKEEAEKALSAPMKKQEEVKEKEEAGLRYTDKGVVIVGDDEEGQEEEKDGESGSNEQADQSHGEGEGLEGGEQGEDEDQGSEGQGAKEVVGDELEPVPPAPSRSMTRSQRRASRQR